MSQHPDLDVLERRVADDPGATGFATLAEAYRRAGRLDDARRVAVAGLAVRPDDTSGRLALGLTLLDLGEGAAARYELERAMGSASGLETPARDAAATHAGPGAAARLSPAVGGPEALGDDELDAAFDLAEPIEDQMIDANQIAEQAIRASELDDPEGFPAGASGAFGVDPADEIGDDVALEGDAEDTDGFRLEDTSAFATATMARLLDEQGDRERADAIRGRLDAAEVPSHAPSAHPTGAEGATADRVLATLETWLSNVQGGRG